MKDGSYVMNLVDELSKGISWISLLIDKHAVMYFDSSGTEDNSREQSKAHQSLTTYLDYNIMILSHMGFIVLLW